MSIYNGVGVSDAGWEEKVETEVNTKQSILVIATHLFYKRGFAGASIRDIARAAGISNATIYLHFRDKDYILFEIIERIGANLLTKLYQVIDIYDDPLECLRAMVRAQICLTGEKHEETKIFLEEQRQLPNGLREQAHELHQKIYQLYYEKVHEMKEKEMICNVDQTVVAFSIFAMMNWIIHWYDPGGRLGIPDVTEDIIRIFLKGIVRERTLP